ncbi:hypothetical protein PsYK624_143010 [Phanerochaete sordida]|uniref:DUF6535 domain-containing protein n=1 Tax=Phanerochaete sordida TaxID=48140 RepID=A0A9P3LKW9_9APHY|nr:hypothetical protein PsYK624_143010 [Phanerochaete sordida]
MASSSQPRKERPSTLRVSRQDPSFGSDVTAVDGSASDSREDGWIDEEAGDIEMQQSPTALRPRSDCLQAGTKPPASIVSGDSDGRSCSKHRRISRRDRTRERRCRHEDHGSEFLRQSKTTSCWRKCKKVLSKHDKSLVEGWREDIDTLLVFSGLFSAVLTAFVVESYSFLQPDPQGTTTDILRDMLGELRNIRAGVTSPPASPSADPEFPFISDFPQSFAIRVNVLWFTSLVFSLAAATIGILVKQWLRDYVRHSGGSAREKARVRQLRHNDLLTFHIHEVIAALPILLQWSLAFFFIGLVDLLWNLNFIVAAIVTCFVTAALAFFVVTTVLPSLRADSPHRSPQALALYLSYTAGVRLLLWLVAGKLRIDAHNALLIPLNVAETQWRRRWRLFKSWLAKLLHERAHSNWHEREQYLVRGQEVELDCQILVAADAMYMDNRILEEVIRPCVEEVPAPAASKCVTQIVTNRAHGTLDGKPMWRSSDTLDEGVIVLAQLTLDVLARLGDSDDQEAVHLLDLLKRLCHAIRFEDDHPLSTRLYERVYATVSRLLTHEGVGRDGFHLLYTLLSRASPSVQVDSTVIEHIATFGTTARDARQDSDTYFSACVMTIQFSTRLPPDEQRGSEARVGTLLAEMEHFVRETQALPSPALLHAINSFAENNASSVMGHARHGLEQLSRMVASIRANLAASSRASSESA